MADFSYLKSLDVGGTQTTVYDMSQISINGLTPKLTVAPATDANKPYFNEVLRLANKASKSMKRGRVSASMISENRNDDRSLFPKYILKGWTDVQGSDGVDVQFSVAEAKEFIEALPDWLFDDLRSFCGDPANFVNSVDIDVEDRIKN